MESLLIVGIVLALAARIIGKATGLLYNDAEIRRWDLILILLLTLFVGLRSWRRRKNATISGRFDEIAAPLAFAGAVVAFTAVVAPINSTKAGEPPCEGALLMGASSVATSRTGGVNARTEPSRSSPLAGRFAGDCSIGFDAFCISDPLRDLAFPDTWTETRWLRVHRNRGWKHGLSRLLLSSEPGGDWFVSGGVVVGEVNGTRLPLLRKKECGLDSRDPPGKVTGLSVKPDPAKSGEFRLAATAAGANNLGYAIWLDNVPVASYRQVAAGNVFTASWNYGLTASSLAPNTTTHVVLLAIGCLAPNVPAPAATAATLTFELSQTGQLRLLTLPKLTIDDRPRLERTACQSPS